MNDNTLIRVFGAYAIIVVGAGLGILFNYDGDKIQAFGLLTGLVLLFIPVLLGFKKSADAADQATEAASKASIAATEAAASTAQSEQNTKTLAVMAPQVRQAVIKSTEAATQSSAAVDAVADNTILTEQLSGKADKTHEVFNGAAHEWRVAIEAIARLEVEVASLKGTAAGIETGRQQVKDDIAAIVTPPTDAHESATTGAKAP